MRNAHFGSWMVFAASVSIVALTAIGACGKLSSSVSGEAGKKLTLVAPADQSITQGGTEALAVVIVRKNFDDIVDFEINELPSGITVAEGSKLSIPAGKLKSESVTLLAAVDASVVKNHRVSVTAKGPDGIAVTEYFRLTVKARE